MRGGPAERRAFLDTALCQLKPVYLSSLQKYNLILSQRNALLKSAAEKKPESFDLTMSVWSAQLAREAVYIASERAAYVNSLTRFVSPFFADLSGGKEEISLSYSHLYTEEEYLTKLTINIEREIAAGATLYGIHKDDVAITLNGKEARFFASQGQQRSIAFALKLGEGKIAEETGGDSPIYLMDDVLSELDAERRSFVLSSLRGKQTFVTTCIPDDFAGVPAERFRVKNGNIIPAAP